MSGEDPKMMLYEAQAIAIEKDNEIAKLKAKNEELQRQLNERQVWKTVKEIKEKLKMVNIAAPRVELTVSEERIEEDKNDAVENKFEQIERRLKKIEQEILESEKWKADVMKTLERLILTEETRRIKKETILIIGQQQGSQNADDLFILNKRRSAWKALSLKLPCGLSRATIFVENDEIHVIGGDEIWRKVYKLNNEQMKWNKLYEEDRSNFWSTSLFFDGCIWYFGEWTSNGINRRVKCFSLEQKKWIEKPLMKKVRTDAAEAIYNKKIILSGGRDGRYPLYKSVACYDPTTGEWNALKEMPAPRYCHSMISYENSLIVMGGMNRGTFNTVWKINPDEKKSDWKELESMKEKRAGSSVALLDNEIYIIGGMRGEEGKEEKDKNRVEIFDGESWRYGPELGLPSGYRFWSPIVISPRLAENLLQYNK